MTYLTYVCDMFGWEDLNLGSPNIHSHIYIFWILGPALQLDPMILDLAPEPDPISLGLAAEPNPMKIR